MQIDKDAVLARYRAERDKRLRPDGNDQYLEMAGHYDQLLEDPYTPRIERPPVTDHVTFAMVGGGFAGLCVGARLVEAGITDVRIIDKAGDFGGTWYWNRYPGAQCDTASMIYLPLLEETGHVPTEKYAHAPEILEQSRRIGRTFGLYEKALFHTRVTEMAFDEARNLWVIETDRGDTALVLKGEEDIRRLQDNALLIADIHGINYLIRNRLALDATSKKILDRFL